MFQVCNNPNGATRWRNPTLLSWNLVLPSWIQAGLDIYFLFRFYSINLWALLSWCFFLFLSMKHGLRHGHLTRHGHVDTANVKNIGHQHRYVYVNLFKDGLKWKLKYIYKHLTSAIYVIRKSSTTRYNIIWTFFIHLLLKMLKMI